MKKCKAMTRILWLVGVVLVTVSPLSGEEFTLYKTLEGHSGGVYSVAWSPDGKTLASGSSDKTIRLWDVSNGKIVTTLEAKDWVACCNMPRTARL